MTALRTCIWRRVSVARRSSIWSKLLPDSPAEIRLRHLADRLAGAYESAAAQLQTAAESFERMGMRWQLARTLSEKAELAAVRSQADECRAFYAQALSLFEQLGAAPAAKQVRARLDEL